MFRASKIMKLIPSPPLLPGVWHAPDAFASLSSDQILWRCWIQSSEHGSTICNRCIKTNVCSTPLQPYVTCRNHIYTSTNTCKPFSVLHKLSRVSKNIAASPLPSSVQKQKKHQCLHMDCSVLICYSPRQAFSNTLHNTYSRPTFKHWYITSMHTSTVWQLQNDR